MNNFSSVIWSEDEIDNLSREELSENVDENEVNCPDCGRSGTVGTVFFKLNDLIIDMQRSTQKGRITLNGSKANSILNSCDLGADNGEFSFYDYLNALTIFDTELTKLREKNQSNEQGGLQTLKSEPDGGFIFSAKLNDESPYIIPFGVSTYGFSYEEIDRILMDLRKETKARLEQSNMPY
jgi:hypothetical protein